MVWFGLATKVERGVNKVSEWLGERPEGCDKAKAFVFKVQVAGQCLGLFLSKHDSDKVGGAVVNAGLSNFVNVV